MKLKTLEEILAEEEPAEEMVENLEEAVKKRKPNLGEEKRRKRKKSLLRKEFTRFRWRRHGLDRRRSGLLVQCR
jgi:hypothetical protein